MWIVSKPSYYAYTFLFGLIASFALGTHAKGAEHNPCEPCPYPLPYGSNCPSAGVVQACERSKYADEYHKSVSRCGLLGYWKEGCK